MITLIEWADIDMPHVMDTLTLSLTLIAIFSIERITLHTTPRGKVYFESEVF